MANKIKPKSLTYNGFKNYQTWSAIVSIQNDKAVNKIAEKDTVSSFDKLLAEVLNLQAETLHGVELFNVWCDRFNGKQKADLCDVKRHSQDESCCENRCASFCKSPYTFDEQSIGYDALLFIRLCGCQCDMNELRELIGDHGHRASKYTEYD